MTTPLHVHVIVSMPFAENTCIVWKDGQSDALVIDPGLEPNLIFDFLTEKNLTPAAILNTHGHADHIAGNEAMKTAFPDAPLIIGANDAVMLSDANANLSAACGLSLISPLADQLVREGDVLEFAGIRLDVLDVPGHSPGHVAFVHRGEPIQVFGGDILFQGSVGRVDFPGGDGKLLMQGIRQKLFILPDDAIVYPGHGPTTTIEREKKTNPFVGENAMFEM